MNQESLQNKEQTIYYLRRIRKVTNFTIYLSNLDIISDTRRVNCYNVNFEAINEKFINGILRYD